MKCTQNRSINSFFGFGKAACTVFALQSLQAPRVQLQSASHGTLLQTVLNVVPCCSTPGRSVAYDAYEFEFINNPCAPCSLGGCTIFPVPVGYAGSRIRIGSCQRERIANSVKSSEAKAKGDDLWYLVISCDILYQKQRFAQFPLFHSYQKHTSIESACYALNWLRAGCNPLNSLGVVPSCFHTTASSCWSGAQSLVSVGPLASEPSVSKASVMSHR